MYDGGKPYEFKCQHLQFGRNSHPPAPHEKANSKSDVEKPLKTPFLGGITGLLPDVVLQSIKDPTDLNTRLSRREMEVLKLVTEGFTNSQISQVLSISAHTVKCHIISIFNKLGVSDRTQAAVQAIRLGII